MCSHPKKRCQIKNVLHVNLIFYFIQLSSTVFNKRELTPYFFQLRNLSFIKLNTLFGVLSSLYQLTVKWQYPFPQQSPNTSFFHKKHFYKQR